MVEGIELSPLVGVEDRSHGLHYYCVTQLFPTPQSVSVMAQVFFNSCHHNPLEPSLKTFLGANDNAFKLNPIKTRHTRHHQHNSISSHRQERGIDIWMLFISILIQLAFTFSLKVCTYSTERGGLSTKREGCRCPTRMHAFQLRLQDVNVPESSVSSFPSHASQTHFWQIGP